MHTERIHSINLDGTLIGSAKKCYIIAEIGQNHNGDMDLAFNQVYDNPNSFGKTYGEHCEFLEFNLEQYADLKKYAVSKEITYFCTPCDTVSFEQLESINCPFNKVASRGITNIPPLEKLFNVGKPVIISTGMASIDVTKESVDIFLRN